MIKALLAVLLMASISPAQDTWRPYPSQYYEFTSDTGVVLYADMQTIGKYETSYRFGARFNAMADSARIFIPTDNVDAMWIEYRLLADTTIDSTYINIAYGSATQVAGRNLVYPIEVLQDSSTYWYGNLIRRCVSLACPGFPAPFLVLLVDGSSKFPSTQYPFVEFFIYTRRRI